MEPAEAEILALNVLSWAATVPGALQRFSAHSGVENEDLRQLAGEPELLAALLEFLLTDDALTKAYCNDAGIESRLLHQARRALPGGSYE